MTCKHAPQGKQGSARGSASFGAPTIAMALKAVLPSSLEKVLIRVFRVEQQAVFRLVFRGIRVQGTRAEETEIDAADQKPDEHDRDQRHGDHQKQRPYADLSFLLLFHTTYIIHWK